jgi:serine/threonine protein kinase/Flp pilus assembly protein TadD
MKAIRKFFNDLKKPAVKPPPGVARAIPFRHGEKIGLHFTIYGVLGKGGFGIVLCVYNHETYDVCALKTFRDELLADQRSRDTFRTEAANWVNLGKHPFIVSARGVREIANRLFVVMEFIPRDELGRATLADYLIPGSHEIGLEKTLLWGIQFCHAMEHAQKHGVQCHRDIKPQNILIARGETLKLSDFGLAMVAQSSQPATVAPISHHPSEPALSIINLEGRQLCGTPGYIAPEVFRGEGADIRSDIYSFGLVLWQMAMMSPKPPFADYLQGDIAAFLKTVYETQMASQAPPTGKPIDSVIEKCLRTDPEARFQTFTDVREDLERLLRDLTGKTVELPTPEETTAADWFERGVSLASVGQHKEGLAAFNQAVTLAPEKVEFQVSRGACLIGMAQYQEAIEALDRILGTHPDQAQALYNKGNALELLNNPADALACHSRAVEVYPTYQQACYGRGRCLSLLGKPAEALKCFDRSLEIYSRDAQAWSAKGSAYRQLKRFEDALACYEQALAVDPLSRTAWLNKGLLLSSTNKPEEAIRAFERCIEIDPGYSMAWTEKARALYALQRDQAVRVCIEEALRLDPRNGSAWRLKAALEETHGNFKEAGRCLAMFVDVAGPSHQAAVPGVMAHIRELERKLAA